MNFGNDSWQFMWPRGFSILILIMELSATRELFNLDLDEGTICDRDLDEETICNLDLEERNVNDLELDERQCLWSLSWRKVMSATLILTKKFFVISVLTKECLRPKDLILTKKMFATKGSWSWLRKCLRPRSWSWLRKCLRLKDLGHD